jgi:hypothetical protein
MSSPSPKPSHNLLRHEVGLSAAELADGALADVATVIAGTQRAEMPGAARLCRRLLDREVAKIDPSNHGACQDTSNRKQPLVRVCEFGRDSIAFWD